MRAGVHDEVAVGLDLKTIANVARGTRCPQSFAVLIVEYEIAVSLHDQTSSALIVGEALAGQKVAAAGKRGVAKIDWCRRGRSRRRLRSRRRHGNIANDRVGCAAEGLINHTLMSVADHPVPLLKVKYLAVEESVVTPVALAEKALTVCFQAWTRTGRTLADKSAINEQLRDAAHVSAHCNNEAAGTDDISG